MGWLAKEFSHKSRMDDDDPVAHQIMSSMRASSTIQASQAFRLGLPITGPARPGNLSGIPVGHRVTRLGLAQIAQKLQNSPKEITIQLGPTFWDVDYSRNIISKPD